MAFIRNFPLFRILLFFIFGLCSAEYVKFVYFKEILVSLVFLWMLILIIHKKLSFKLQFVSGVLILLIAYGCGLLRMQESDFRNSKYALREQKATYIICIDEPPLEKPKSVKIVAEVLGENDRKYTGRWLFYLKKDSNSLALKYGDKLVVSAQPKVVEAPKNPEEFDYQNYLKNNNVYHQNYLNPHEWRLLEKQKGFSLRAYAYQCRDYLTKVLAANGLKGEEFAVSTAILLGDCAYLDPDLIKVYQGTGIVHVLSVSGMHVGLFAMVLLQITFFMQYRKETQMLRMLLILLAVWAYAMMTGFSPSVLRSAVMFSFITIGQTLNRNTSIYNSLIVSALFLLMVEPRMFYSVGFQLSYLAIVGIAALQPYILNWWPKPPKYMKSVWELTAVSIAAQLITMPLTIYYFHQFPNYFLIANLIAGPLSTAIIPLGMAVFAGSFAWPVLGEWIGKLLSLVIKMLNESMTFIDGLPFAVSHGLWISMFEQTLLYLLILLAFVMFVNENKRMVFPVLILIIGFFSSQFIRKINHFQHPEMIVFHLNGQSAIAYSTGNTLNFVCDSSAKSQTEKWQRYVENYCMKRNLSKQHFLNDQHFYLLGNQKIAIVSQENRRLRSQKPLEVDVLLIRGNPNVKLSEMIETYHPKTIIVDGSNKNYRIEKWKREPLPEGTKLHITAERGAYCKSLTRTSVGD